MNNKLYVIEESTVSLLVRLVGSGSLTEARLDAALKDVGVSVTWWWALRHLSRTGAPVPLSKLAGMLDCAKSNATHLVDRLEAGGLARRIPDPKDRRSVMAEVTAEGRRRYEDGLRALSVVERELRDIYSRKELVQLDGLMARLEEAWR